MSDPENLGQCPFQCSPQPPRLDTPALTQEERSRRWTYDDADAQLSPESRTAALKRLYYKQAQDWEVYVKGEMLTLCQGAATLRLCPTLLHLPTSERFHALFSCPHTSIRRLPAHTSPTSHAYSVQWCSRMEASRRRLKSILRLSCTARWKPMLRGPHEWRAHGPGQLPQ